LAAAIAEGKIRGDNVPRQKEADDSVAAKRRTSLVRSLCSPPLPKITSRPLYYCSGFVGIEGHERKKRPNAGTAFGKSWKTSVERRAKTTERGEPFDRTRSKIRVYFGTKKSLTSGKAIEPEVQRGP
jgi:hypothetical protein